jgi:spore coat protein CotH
MHKIKRALPVLLFLTIAIVWSILKVTSDGMEFSFDIVHTLKLKMDEEKYQSVFSKFGKGSGTGLLSIDNEKQEETNIRLGGESTQEDFHETQDMGAATLHLTFSRGPDIKLLSLYDDPSFSREYLAYEVFGEFFELLPEYNFVKMSVNDQNENLYLAIEKINTKFFQRRKMLKLYQSSKAEDIRFLITSKAYSHLLPHFDEKVIFQYLLFAYLVDDQDGPFSGKSYTENATLVRDKIFGKYILIPNDLDQTFNCRLNELEDQIFELASFVLKNSGNKEALYRILTGTEREVQDKMIENAENDIHQKLSFCCSNFLTPDYEKARTELHQKIQCQKERFSRFVNRLRSLPMQ